MRRVHFDVTDSTSVQVRQLAAQYRGECVAVTAAEQTAGRGRQGREWRSPRGGAWLSLAWPMRNAPYDYGAVSLVAAIAVVRALAEVAPECAELLQVKWPNDVLLSGRKVAGILCEQSLGAAAGSPAVLIVGVGVNVDFDVSLFPADLRHPATTLRQATGRSVPVERVADAVVGRLVEQLHDFEAAGLSESLLEELRGRLAYVGSVRSVELGGRVVTGRIAGVDSQGRLMLHGPEGELVLASGELVEDRT